MSVHFPRRASTGDSKLREDVQELCDRRLGSLAGGFPIIGVTIGTGSTSIGHGMRTVPKGAVVLPYANAVIWRAAAPDSTSLYLQASVSVTADVWVIP